MKDKILSFLKKHVIGKTLETDEIIYSLEGGRLEGVYSDKMNFSDLIVTQNGFQFNMTTIAEENIFLKETSGERSDLIKDFTGIGTYHYEFAFRKSTSEITGIMRLLSASSKEQTMEAVVYGIYDVKYENGEFSWKEQQLLYRDMPKDKDSYRPTAFDSDARFYLKNKKIQFEYIPIYYDVDPKTLKKTISKDQYPSFVSKEK